MEQIVIWVFAPDLTAELTAFPRPSSWVKGGLRKKNRAGVMKMCGK